MFEKVNPAHPDKVADRIGGAIVDLAYSKEENPRVAVEVMIGHGVCHTMVETSASILPCEIDTIIERIAGKDVKSNPLVVPQDVHLAANQKDKIRCGDNGIFKGVPVTDEQWKLVKIARDIYEKYPTDGKYILDGDKLIICQSCADTEELKREYPGAIVNPLGDWTGGPNSDSGCIDEDEIIVTNEGLKRIKDIKEGDIVLSKNEWNKVTDVLDRGIKKTIKVIDKRGHSLKVTPDHPFLVFRDNRFYYKEAKDLTNEDFLVRRNCSNAVYRHKVKRAFKYGRGVGEKKEFNTDYPKQAYFLGYLIGDGWFNESDGSIFLSVDEPKVEYIKSLICDAWQIIPCVYTSERKDNRDIRGSTKDTKVAFFSKDLCSVFNDIGLKKGALNKCVPDCILTAASDIKYAFLCGLFEADGCFRIQKSGRDSENYTNQITFVSISERLVCDVAAMLNELGIQTSVYKRNKYDNPKCPIHSNYPSFSLSIPEEISKQKFIKHIRKNSLFERKYTKSEDREFQYQDHREFPCSCVSGLINKDLYLKNRYALEKYSDITAIKTKRNISYQKLTYVLDVYGKYANTEEYKFAQNMLKYDLIPFKEIIPCDERHVYDINVENEHCFTANGFIVHNCTNRKLGSDMANSATGGGLSGKDCSKADVSVNIYAWLKAQLTNQTVWLSCAIGDEFVDNRPYEEIVDIAKEFINRVGGFEQFSAWGMVCPKSMEEGFVESFREKMLK